jgi:hypothetical protein
MFGRHSLKGTALSVSALINFFRIRIVVPECRSVGSDTEHFVGRVLLALLVT